MKETIRYPSWGVRGECADSSRSHPILRKASSSRSRVGGPQSAKWMVTTHAKAVRDRRHWPPLAGRNAARANRTHACASPGRRSGCGGARRPRLASSALDTTRGRPDSRHIPRLPGYRSVHVLEQVESESSHRLEHAESRCQIGAAELHGEGVRDPGA